MAHRTLAVIGGSGLYSAGEVRVVREHQVTTPWGTPSAPIVESEIGERTVYFLPRHGPGHTLPPGDVPFRANIAALKHLGVDTVISVSAVGSLREEYAPGDLVLPDQFIDRTRHRADSFFEAGCVAHVSLADPFCPDLAQQISKIIPERINVHNGGTYINMEGPQFSTRAESHLYRSWGASIIGMTNLSEARLAREAELCYLSLCFVTDYDCWREGDEVSVEQILAVLQTNGAAGQALIRNLVRLPPQEHCTCHTALEYAIVTAPESRDCQVVEKLRWIANRVL